MDYSKQGRASRQRGKRGELELSKELSRLFHTHCYRSQQFSGYDGDSDVQGLAGISVECKRVEKLSIHKAMNKAVEDSKEHEIPVVCHRKDGEPWLFTARLEDMPAIAEKLYQILHEQAE
jgi:hypothetical protein